MKPRKPASLSLGHQVQWPRSDRQPLNPLYLPPIERVVRLVLSNQTSKVVPPRTTSKGKKDKSIKEPEISQPELPQQPRNVRKEDLDFGEDYFSMERDILTPLATPFGGRGFRGKSPGAAPPWSAGGDLPTITDQESDYFTPPKTSPAPSPGPQNQAASPVATPGPRSRRLSHFDPEQYLQRTYIPLPYGAGPNTTNNATASNSHARESTGKEAGKRKSSASIASYPAQTPKIHGRRVSVTLVRQTRPMPTPQQKLYSRRQRKPVKLQPPPPPVLHRKERVSALDLKLALLQLNSEWKEIDGEMSELVQDKEFREGRIRLLALKKVERRHAALQARIVEIVAARN
ncbi:MAG: hypothetical protein SGCHY_001796 [Lobulomycetales sp.]